MTNIAVMVAMISNIHIVRGPFGVSSCVSKLACTACVSNMLAMQVGFVAAVFEYFISLNLRPEKPLIREHEFDTVTVETWALRTSQGNQQQHGRGNKKKTSFKKTSKQSNPRSDPRRHPTN